eukprot:1141633-Pelagomonas_calceolata.AAC.4
MACLVEGNVDSATHTQEGCAETDLSTLKLFAEFPYTLGMTAAAILQGQLHIAIDSLSSLHQIRKQIMNPDRQHVQGYTLRMIIQLVHNSPAPIYLYKVISHAEIAGNKCADVIAKHQAIQVDSTPADTAFPSVNLEGNPFHDTTWLAFEETASTHASTSERPAHMPQSLNMFPTFMTL